MPILKSSKALVYDLINAANPQLPFPLTADNCRLEKIKAVTPSEANGFRNTQVRVRGVQGEGFQDQFTLYYDRMALDKVIRPVAAGTSAGSMFVTYTSRTFHQALPVITLSYGVELGTWDIADASLPSPEVPNAVSLVTLAVMVAATKVLYWSENGSLRAGVQGLADNLALPLRVVILALLAVIPALLTLALVLWPGFFPRTGWSLVALSILAGGYLERQLLAAEAATPRDPPKQTPAAKQKSGKTEQ